MRLKIRHKTSYHYEVPAKSAIQLLRLTPRNHGGQFVRRWRVEVEADYRLDRDEDALGNITHTFTIEGPISDMHVAVEGEVDTENTNGIISNTVERFPLQFWLRESLLTAPDAKLRRFARQALEGEGGDRLAALHTLMGRINTEFAFRIGDTHSATTAVEAFEKKAGVCQDLAQVFVAAARSIGIPARYVGGYFLRTDTELQEAGHAWAEAYLPDVGWIGFDPANGVCVTERYVRIATGIDSLDAAPIRGARLGGLNETMAVTVTVAAGRTLVEG
jgi:transglutaminase-like putative cysteine protease